MNKTKMSSKTLNGLLNRTMANFHSSVANAINTNRSLLEANRMPSTKLMVDEAISKAKMYYHREAELSGLEVPEWDDPRVIEAGQDMVRGYTEDYAAVKAKWEGVKKEKSINTTELVAALCRKIRKLGRTVAVVDGIVEIKEETSVNELLTALNARGYKVLTIEKDGEEVEVEDK